MPKRFLTVSVDDGVVRVDKYLADKFPEYSRAAIAKLFTLNLVKRDGISLKPGEKIRPDTIIEYDLGPLQAVPEVIDLPILYEDDDVIVVDKPAGIISHARGKFWQEASVASFIRDRVTQLSGERAGIVHRLDRATSGVIICAKNEAALRFLQKQFHDRLVNKTYIAIVDHAPPHPVARIEAPIERNPNKPKEFMVSIHGKHAITRYSILNSTNGIYTLELHPETGRTHQLRVHLQYIKCPIIGDDLYGGRKYNRLLLHAVSLTITLPNGLNTTFTSPLPKEFYNVPSTR